MPAGDMDTEYSVGVKNRFIGIDSDIIDDPLELIRAAQEKPKKEKDVKTKGRKETKVTAKVTKEKLLKTEALSDNTNIPESKRYEGSERQRGRGRGGRSRGGERGRGRGGRGGGFGSVGSPREESSGSFGDNTPNSGPRGPRGACHRCGEEGHFVRNCPQQPKSPNGSATQSEGFGGPSGGFGGPSGGFGAPGGGFGAPGGGFGAPGGGFGAPSGGFGSPSGFDQDEEKRGGRGGFRGGRGGRGGRGRGGRGGREFDRRSGSDKSSVKAFDKREGSGSYNWGTPQDELAASEEQNMIGTTKDPEDLPTETTEPVEETENISSDETKEETQPKEMSFAEWKQQQQEARSKPQYNIRKANEGERFKGVKQIKKPTEEENEADGSLFFPKKYYEEKLKTSGRVKEHMNLNFQFTSGENRHLDNERARRGGRGRGRGGRGGRKDDGTGFGGPSKNIQLEDTEEFPCL